MQSYELLKELLQKTSAKHVAAETGLSLSMVYKWAEPAEEGSGTSNPLDRIAQLPKATGDTPIAPWVCASAGASIIKNSKAGVNAPQLIPAAHDNVQQLD